MGVSLSLFSSGVLGTMEVVWTGSVPAGILRLRGVSELGRLPASTDHRHSAGIGGVRRGSEVGRLAALLPQENQFKGVWSAGLLAY